MIHRREPRASLPYSSLPSGHLLLFALATMTEPCTLGYHKIRGLGAPCRMLLCFSGEPFYNKAYAGDLKEEWFAKDKPALVARNSYINLPYVIDGDTVVTQSNSVLLYLGRKLAIDKDADFFANHQAGCATLFLSPASSPHSRLTCRRLTSAWTCATT